MMNHGGMSTGWAAFCVVVGIAIIAFIVWAIVASTNRREARDAQEASRPDALVVLERRFAKGEIDDREYQRRRQLLTQR